MKRNKQRIIYTEKFHLNHFTFSWNKVVVVVICPTELSICFRNHFDHNLHLPKLNEWMNGKITDNTIELMNVKCEFNQAFNSPFFLPGSFFFLPSVVYFSRDFDVNALSPMHNLIHRRVYFNSNATEMWLSIKHYLIRCDDNLARALKVHFLKTLRFPTFWLI